MGICEIYAPGDLHLSGVAVLSGWDFIQSNGRKRICWDVAMLKLLSGGIKMVRLLVENLNIYLQIPT